jgi:hypothetical protein
MHEGLPNESWYKCPRCILECNKKKAKVRLLFKLYLIAGKKLAKTEELK